MIFLMQDPTFWCHWDQLMASFSQFLLCTGGQKKQKLKMLEMWNKTENSRNTLREFSTFVLTNFRMTMFVSFDHG